MALADAPAADVLYGGVMDVDMVVEQEAGEPVRPVTLPGEIEQPTQANRMIVTTFHLQAETMEFDESVGFIESYVHQLGGYIENRSESGRSIGFEDRSARSAFFTVRVPSQSIRHFVTALGEEVNVTHTQESAEDITERFFDSQARLSSLVNQERLLNELLEEGGDLEFILEVHRELAHVRHQIESLSSSIQRMERAVNYSTVHINLQEVMQLTPVNPLPLTFNQRIQQAMSNSRTSFVNHLQRSIENFIWRFPFLVLDLLGLLFWVVVFLIIRLIIRKRRGRTRGERTFDWWPPWRSNSAASNEKNRSTTLRKEVDNFNNATLSSEQNNPAGKTDTD